jgi:hypothetical protein
MRITLKAATATAVSLRIANARGLQHRKGYSPASRACDAADWREGKLLLQHPTLEQASAIFAVSLPSIMRAQGLSPAQREEVRRGWRPLAPNPPVLPALPAPAVPVAVPLTVMQKNPVEAQFRLLLGVIGVDRALTLMAELDDAQRIAA